METAMELACVNGIAFSVHPHLVYSATIPTHSNNTFFFGKYQDQMDHKAKSLKPVRFPMHPPVGSREEVVFSEDGTRLLLVTLMMVEIWNITTWESAKALLRSEPFDDDGWFTDGCFSPDGQKVAASTDTGCVYVLDARTGTISFVVTSEISTTSAVFSHDGKYIATPGSNMVLLWNAENGGLVAQLQGSSPSKPSVITIIFSPDLNVAAGLFRGSLRGSDDSADIVVWNIHTLETLVIIPNTSHLGACLAFSPDGTLLAYQDMSYVYVWETLTGSEVCSIVLPHTHDVLFSDSFSSRDSSLWFSHDGTMLMSTTRWTFTILDSKTGDLFTDFDHPLHRYFSPRASPYCLVPSDYKHPYERGPEDVPQVVFLHRINLEPETSSPICLLPGAILARSFAAFGNRVAVGCRLKHDTSCVFVLEVAEN